MKPAHLMTLEEYRENVSPLIVEFKAILRKKFLFDCTFNEWKYVTYEEYKSEAMQECEQRVNELMAQVVAMEKETGKPHPNPNLRVELMQNGIDSIEERIEKEQIKRTTMPVEMRSRAKEILQELSERFTINARFDLKALEKTHKPVIRHALESDSYISLLLTDELSHDQLEKICASVDIKIPKRIYQFKSMNTDYHRDALLPFNRAFYDSLIANLSPYTKQIADSKLINLKRYFDDFYASGYSSLKEVIPFAEKHQVPDAELRDLFKVIDKGWDDSIDQIVKDYIDQLILRFIYRAEEKLSLIVRVWQVPNIEFHQLHFNKGILESKFVLKFNNGEVITGYASIILAGGYEVVLHTRYLIKLQYKGKTLSQEQLDSLVTT